MRNAYIIDGVRTAVGRRGGGLSTAHPADLAAHVITALVERAGVDPAVVDDVVLGCTDTVGPQAGDIARTAWLAAGFPEHVPGVTVDRNCGSSQQALHFAAQAVISGSQDVVVAGGVQNMSMVPMGSSISRKAGFGSHLSGCAGWAARYGDEEISQFRGAELMAEKWGISREEMERYALESHRRARCAISEGRFDDEIVPYEGVAVDEGPRETSLGAMAQLPTLREGGRLTAALSSQIADGASAMLVASEEAAEAHHLTPRARVHHMGVIGSDPVFMLTGPIEATERALAKTGLSIDDIDRFECNEAFAPVVIAWLRETGADPERVNVNGGAIALGHPIGATGARLMTTLLHELDRVSARFGLQVMCEGGGQANVTIVERVAERTPTP